MALLSGLALSPAHAATDWIYIQKRPDGVTEFTDKKPVRGAYKKVSVRGRPTASASCRGLTAQSMAARAEAYAPLIQKYARAEGLSPDLVSAVMRVESCYDRHAVSRAGARGLMQLMPGTARELGVLDSFDPEQNIEGGVRYLARMLGRFGNDVRLALAAYNAGPEAVTAYNDVPPYAETKSYVTRILKLYQPRTS
ncbi:MAG TPA: lytic transglycosylase domain-containing protein [Verrucomicrobiae bacterium]|nr:lytic transglycosylase domain-containing protein [Verrucomicrobiae bacterium]